MRLLVSVTFVGRFRKLHKFVGPEKRISLSGIQVDFFEVQKPFPKDGNDVCEIIDVIDTFVLFLPVRQQRIQRIG